MYFHFYKHVEQRSEPHQQQPLLVTFRLVPWITLWMSLARCLLCRFTHSGSLVQKQGLKLKNTYYTDAENNYIIIQTSAERETRQSFTHVKELANMLRNCACYKSLITLLCLSN